MCIKRKFHDLENAHNISLTKSIGYRILYIILYDPKFVDQLKWPEFTICLQYLYIALSIVITTK